MPLNESDIYESLKSLMNYLRTQVEIAPGEVLKLPNTDIKKTKPGHIIKIIVTNTAPVENTWPMIVYTGVCLVTKRYPGSVNTFSDWERPKQYKVDISKAQRKDVISSMPESSREMMPLYQGADNFPILTSDEEKHGYSLFPGQKIVFEIGVIGENTPSVRDLNLWVQGTLSRRHLLQTIRPII